MRENAAAAAMLTPVTKPNKRIGDDGGGREPPRQPFAGAIAERIEIARGSAFGEEVAHQHEQRDDGEDVVAQRFVGGAGDEIAHHLDVARHQIDAERRGDAERNGDMHAGKHQPEQHDHNDDHVEMAEHDASSDLRGRGGRLVRRPAGHERVGGVQPVEYIETTTRKAPNRMTMRAGQTGTRSAPSPSYSPLVQACSVGS